MTFNRRDFLTAAGAATVASGLPRAAFAQPAHTHALLHDPGKAAQ